MRPPTYTAIKHAIYIFLLLSVIIRYIIVYQLISIHDMYCTYIDIVLPQASLDPFVRGGAKFVGINSVFAHF